MSNTEKYKFNLTFFNGVLATDSRPDAGEMPRLLRENCIKLGGWCSNCCKLPLSFATGFTLIKIPRLPICSALSRSRCTPSSLLKNKLMMYNICGRRAKKERTKKKSYRAKVDLSCCVNCYNFWWRIDVE